MSATALLALLLAAAVAYNLVNGFQDGPSIVATMIASGAMSARGALALAAACTLAGPALFGQAVAQTLGAEVVAPGVLGVSAAIAAFAAAGLWNAAAWWVGIPVSSSHALIGGLLGAALAQGGWQAIQVGGVVKIAVALVVSPLAGFAVALAVMHGTRWLLRGATPRANIALSHAQVATAAAMALANGANDAQKTAGVLALGLLLLGFSAEFTVPWWTLAISASAIALGTMLGGERIVRTLGTRFYRIRPIHGFSAQLASAMVTAAASIAGGPVSSTQVMSLAIVGSGAADRASKVRWGALSDFGLAWALTVPASALVAMALQQGLGALAQQGGG